MRSNRWGKPHPKPLMRVAGRGASPFCRRPSNTKTPLSTSAEDLGTRSWQGTTYTLRAYRFGDHRIWGATARVLEAIVELL